MSDLAIKDVAERTGLAAGTIRMWEQRYGFPVPERTESGYRRYRPEDVEILRRAALLREEGLSVPAALERARTARPTDHPSLYAAVAQAEPGVHRLKKRTLFALSRAMEEEALARAARPIVFGAFQEDGFYRPVERRYRRLAGIADAAVVFARFDEQREPPGGPVEVPLGESDVLGNEWAVVIDAPGYAACLLAWEDPDTRERGGEDDLDRRFEAMWTVDPEVVRRASHVGAQLAGRRDPALGARLEALLDRRPLAMERAPEGLVLLMNRAIAYVERAAG